MNIFKSRRSVRNYDETYKINREKMHEILTLANRAPSLMNLQPTRFIVVESSEAKDLIRPSMYGNLLQLDTSSAMIIIATDLNKFESGIDVFNNAEKEGIIPTDVANRQRDLIAKLNETHPKELILTENNFDAGLISMQLMLVAKEYGYDTCAIGGFNKQTILKNLGINEPNLLPIVIISIGKAKESGFNSYRTDIKDITTYL